MKQRSALHEAALTYARSGIPVFPCLPDDGGPDTGKKPATGNGFENATTDLAQIDAWWFYQPNYNIAFEPEQVGWALIDLEAAGGTEAWDAIDEDKPDTYEVATPRGGRHLYYEGSVRPTVKSLLRRAPKDPVHSVPIDTRGVRSYALLPPSAVAGRCYSLLHNRPIASLPEWIPRYLERNAVEAQAPPAEIDERGAVARARLLLRDYVRQGRLAVIGSGGDDLTLQLAYQLRDLGLSQEKSRELLIEEWYPHCDPNTIPEFIDEKCRNAYLYALNPDQGSEAVCSSTAVFGATVLRLFSLREGETDNKRSKFYLKDEWEQDQAKEVSWIIPGVVPEASTVLIYGPTGSFKSTLALDIAMSVASGTEIFGVKPLQTGWTAYATLEAGPTLGLRRRPAWKLLHGITGPVPFFVTLAPKLAAGELQQFADAVHERAKLQGEKPKLIVIDTIAKSMVGMKSDELGAGQYVEMCDQLRDDFGCAVLSVGHTGKDAERGNMGSQVFMNGLDSHIMVTADKNKIMTMKVIQHKDEEAPEIPFFMKVKKLGRALVLEDMNSAERAAMLRGDDPYEPHKIGQALRELQAVGDDAAIPVRILATKLTMILETDTPEQAAEHIAKTEAALRKLSKGRLSAYVIGTGRDLKWRL